jgi:hypothetical protein
LKYIVLVPNADTKSSNQNLFDHVKINTWGKLDMIFVIGANFYAKMKPSQFDSLISGTFVSKRNYKSDPHLTVMIHCKASDSWNHVVVNNTPF